MTTGVLIALIGLGALVAAGAGYLAGRSQPRAVDLERIATLGKELEAARDELETWRTQAETSAAEAAASREQIESSRAGIDAHFEASAALFGRLAQDYRALFDHFTDSADRLGVSEAQARALVEGVRQELLADPGVADAGSGGDSTDTAESDAVGLRDPQEDADGGEVSGEAATAAPDGEIADVRSETAAVHDPTDRTAPAEDPGTDAPGSLERSRADTNSAAVGAAPPHEDEDEDEGRSEVSDDDVTIRRDP
jgi:uncharacterized membrane-anchored protein YhcB (DUF1043 family)